jgi:PAS domain S-box-containing protein
MVFHGIREESIATPDRYVLMLDKQGHIMNASFNAQQLMGYSPAELLGQPLSIIVPHIPEDVMRILFGHLWLIPDRRTYYFEMEGTHRKKDGTGVPGMFRFKFVETQHGEYCFGLFHAAGPHDEVPEPEFANLPKFRPFVVTMDAMGKVQSIGTEDVTPLGKAATVKHQSLSSYIADEAGRMKLAARLAAKQAFSLQSIQLRMHDDSVKKTDLFVLPLVDQDGAFQHYRTFFYGPEGPLQEVSS